MSEAEESAVESAAPDRESELPREQARARLLLFVVLVVATCGLIYELITATMASYLLGDSVTQFSLVIGVYLSAMGVGSWLSRFVIHRLPDRFVNVQLVIALVGGFSAPALFLGFSQLSSIRPLLFTILIVVGTMVGLEIPLLMRLMPGREQLKDLVARVLAFDYIGALLASISFPLLLLPWLGLVRTSLLFGLFNSLVALWSARVFRAELVRPRTTIGQALVAVALTGTCLLFGKQIEQFGERQLYDAPVIFSQKTAYQRLTITRLSDDIRLFIDGNLQFASIDEHRYHESLVHPAFAAREQLADSPARRALILGGGDGLALRELLRYPSLEHVDLVDLDPRMTELFRDMPILAELNHGALADPRVTIHNADAMIWLEQRRSGKAGAWQPWDVIVVDLPDPNNLSLGKLYTVPFYRLVRAVLADDGVAVVQSTSPHLSPNAYWCIIATLDAAELHPLPYHAHVPSFGDWGFSLIARSPLVVPTTLSTALPADELRFLADDLLPTLFVFPHDQQPIDVEINRLDTQLLVRYYEQDLAALGPRRGGS